MLDNIGFDLWANEYDKSVNLSEENNEYPFAGYRDVLNYVYNKIMSERESDLNILDIGFGTGILTEQLYNKGHKITGIDFSNKMIEIARGKMPQSTLVKWNFSKGLPEEIKDYKFDYIISTYAIHHLTDIEKEDFIKSLACNLTTNGRIILGDVSFETRLDLGECKNKYNKYWDNEEIYFVGEEMIEKLKNEYMCEYIKKSHCAGILVISK
ncbi:methyltransferase, type 12 [Gottschalkia acidurici 9a]|uniref:Methyltransferase, type 12 n=1 Tax=Gottschalkia acidurici (strain ATCC 7906 / DSM 604 / BCRC 14475 / CIP 104303 / KCTC 5404 / NCIMB 10678 / 9a) TaxID=1128398 RepID=K0B335_GOTA9|nr:class I SAM-dependent methyltransferase [Gottschalkia acidurici]AFS79046.1 methyltransferase, type 12 [Gottschalkia acidurici 9a]